MTQERTRLTKTISAEIKKRDRKVALKAARARHARCRVQVSKALDLLESLNRSTTLFLTLQSYGNDLDEADTELDRVPRGALDQQCLVVLSHVGNGVDNHHGAYDNSYSCAVTYASVCDIATDKGRRDLNRSYWGSAVDEFKAAKAALASVGKPVGRPKPPSPFLPRTADSVRSSVYGRTADLFCSANARANTLEPCQALRDILAAGVSEDEEAELNEALSAILQAHGLERAPKPPS